MTRVLLLRSKVQFRPSTLKLSGHKLLYFQGGQIQGFCPFELDVPQEIYREQYCNDFTAQLQILAKPTVELVFRHCQAVCFLHENKNDNEDSSLEQRATKTGVMERIYQF